MTALLTTVAEVTKSKAHTKAKLLAENESQQQELDACRKELDTHRSAMQESKKTVDVLNVQLAILSMTCAKAHQQLASQEEKRAAPKRKEISTALGCMLTHDSFLDAQLEIDHHADDVEEAKKVKEQLEKDWKKFKDEYNEAVSRWKVEVDRRKAAGEKGQLLKPKKMAKKAWMATHITTVASDTIGSCP